jgi:hypothetical protein
VTFAAAGLLFNVQEVALQKRRHAGRVPLA